MPRTSLADNKLKVKEVAERNELVIQQARFQELKLQEMKEKLPRFLNKRRKQFAKEFDEYVKKNTIDGDVFIPEENRIPMFKIIQHTFKPIIKVAGLSPSYSADEISLAFDFYMDCVEKLNEAHPYTPKKEDFCHMINISTNTFDRWQTSHSDENMRNVCDKIQDYFVARVADGAFCGQIDKIYAMFHQKSSNKQRDNDPVQNNTYVQNNTIMSDDQYRDFYLDMSKKFNGEN